MVWLLTSPSLHRGVKRAQIWTSLPSTVPTAAFWPGWVGSKWLYKQCSQSRQLEVQHFHCRHLCTLLAPWCQVCQKPLLHKGLHRFYISLPRCVPSTQQEGTSPGSPGSPLPAGPGPTHGYQGPGEGKGCWASPAWLQGAHWQFRYYRKRSSSFCTAFIRAEARIMSFQLILKLGNSVISEVPGPLFYPLCRGNKAWEPQGVMLWGLVKYMREWLGKLGR